MFATVQFRIFYLTFLKRKIKYTKKFNVPIIFCGHELGTQREEPRSRVSESRVLRSMCDLLAY
jgi:hypothetical protein